MAKKKNLVMVKKMKVLFLIKNKIFSLAKKRIFILATRRMFFLTKKKIFVLARKKILFLATERILFLAKTKILFLATKEPSSRPKHTTLPLQRDLPPGIAPCETRHSLNMGDLRHPPCKKSYKNNSKFTLCREPSAQNGDALDKEGPTPGDPLGQEGDAMGELSRAPTEKMP